MSISGFSRFFAKSFLGAGIFNQASWGKAIYNMEMAVQSVGAAALDGAPLEAVAGSMSSSRRGQAQPNWRADLQDAVVVRAPRRPVG
jgi:hypothetical protein